MAIVPSAANMKFKFPEFAGIDDGTIEFALEEAWVACGSGDWVDDANLALGLMYYAAHLLQVSILRTSSGNGQIISSERIGELSVSYAAPNKNTQSGTQSDFTMTMYGQRFLDLAYKNFPAVTVVNSAVRF